MGLPWKPGRGTLDLRACVKSVISCAMGLGAGAGGAGGAGAGGTGVGTGGAGGPGAGAGGLGVLAPELVLGEQVVLEELVEEVEGGHSWTSSWRPWCSHGHLNSLITPGDYKW